MKRIVSILLAVTLLAAVIGFAGCASSTPYEVSGLVLDGEGKGLAEVTLTFTGGYKGTATTDSAGYWEAAVKGRTTVTPSKPGYAFDPQNKLVTKATSNVDFTGSVDMEFYDETSIMPDSEKPNITYVSEDRSTITFATPSDYVRSLDAGDVIVAGPSTAAEYGLLQRVLSVSPDGLSVETEGAAFTDVVKKGVIGGSSVLTISEMAAKAALKGENAQVSAGSISWPLNKEIIPGVSTSGSITFTNDITFDMLATYEDGLYGFQFLVNLGLETDLTLHAEASMHLERTEYELKSFVGPTIFIYGIPVIPIMKIVVGAEGDLCGQLDINFNDQRTYETGFVYRRGQGFEPVSDIGGSGLAVGEPVFNGTASAFAYGGLEIEALIFGAVGPWAQLYGFGELDAAITLSPSESIWEYDLGIGLEASFGATSEILKVLGIPGEWSINPFRLGEIPIAYGVSGTVKDGSNIGLNNVEMQFSNGADSAYTDIEGKWTKHFLLPGQTTVTPSKVGYTFSPVSRSVTSGGSGIDFTGTTSVQPTYAVSGRVTDQSSNGVSGVQISFTRGYGSVTTASDGSWSKSGLSGTVTVTPSKSGWTFMPLSRQVSTATSTIDFTGAPEVVVPSGQAKIVGSADAIIGLRSDGTVIVFDPNGIFSSFGINTWTNLVDICIGSRHVVGLKPNGTLALAGSNSSGQLNISAWTQIKAVAAGPSHTVGLKSDGTVVAEGDNTYGQCDVSAWTDIISVETSEFHTVGLKSDGTVVAVGYNWYGQCDVSTWTDIISVEIGQYHTVGLKSDGSVVAVGDNRYGQCNVSTWTWADIVAISAGGLHTLGLKSGGTVIAVGDNSYGQVNTYTWTDISIIGSCSMASMGVKSDGTVVGLGAVLDYAMYLHTQPIDLSSWYLW